MRPEVRRQQLNATRLSRAKRWPLFMTLSFPNDSRSYDGTRCAVRFWGYDSAMEASFFVTADALQQLRPGTATDESALLSAFDANREAICAVAANVYARGNKGSYDLLASDFLNVRYSPAPAYRKARGIFARLRAYRAR